MKTVLSVALAAALAVAAPSAQVAMPDPSQMSGVPLPSADLPVGTITVRVVRGAVSNIIPNQKVELMVAGARREGTTDQSGRAEFSGLAPGVQVQAATEVDGRRVESQQITMPAQGGVRVMLVAIDPATAVRDEESARLREAPAVPGMVVFGGESRFIVEHGDESLNVFYVLEIVNTARTPVATNGPLIFDLPSGSIGITLLEGSTPQATVKGSRVTVTGPFAPGKTPLHIAYELPYRGPSATIVQRLPAALPQLAFAGETTGGVTIASPLFAASRDMNAEGRSYTVASGAAIQQGGVLTVSFAGLPHHARWPRFTALGIAVTIMLAGLVLAFRRGPVSTQSGQEALVAARAARFAEIEALEQRRRDGAIDETRYAEERRHLIAALEDIYAALDAR